MATEARTRSQGVPRRNEHGRLFGDFARSEKCASLLLTTTAAPACLRPPLTCAACSRICAVSARSLSALRHRPLRTVPEDAFKQIWLGLEAAARFVFRRRSTSTASATPRPQLRQRPGDLRRLQHAWEICTKVRTNCHELDARSRCVLRRTCRVPDGLGAAKRLATGQARHCRTPLAQNVLEAGRHAIAPKSSSVEHSLEGASEV
ncbi:hypothetical protein OH76DRAFT_1413363 [Lentinus brumalis]|uniref:Uncharacterized protein n=1 Tax=Lentinus brumalis TaxID=2498619 RepID=A0A371CHK9_9APHY|nr:hypothetical protein OH76DRAFT_1413363 [Polyporus brumalis]